MGGEVILVAVDASKEITDYALEWTIGNVIKPMDFLILVAILPLCSPPAATANQTNNYQSHNQLYQFLSGLRWKRDPGPDEKHASSDKSGSGSGDGHEDVSPLPRKINDVCVQMMQQLLSLHNVVQVASEVKVVADAQMGSVATLATELGTTWIILDRRLKKEADCCLKQMNCNVILVDHAIPIILRSSYFPNQSSNQNASDILSNPTVADMLGVVHPTSNNNTNFNTTLATLTSPRFNLGYSQPLMSKVSVEETETTYDRRSMPKYSSKSQPLMSKVSKFDNIASLPPKPSFDSSASPIDKKTRSGNVLPKTRSDVQKSNRVKPTTKPASSPPLPLPRRSSDSPISSQKPKSPINDQPGSAPSVLTKTSTTIKTFDRASSVRRAISLSIKHPPTPPPLCSICKHKSPILGKPPRKFGFEEIERATNGFSDANLLAEGVYGTVYRGVLSDDGLVVAVKRHNVLSAQGASEFCCEVEVLSCAQHRNLVMLVGYCVEMEWLLVYEFACNGSLDKHLHGYGRETNEVMAWQHRMKVAVGAARGLRYLHEDCRVGCIVHRDFRPNNILLTHDFEPMVGDFGLARWQVNGQSAEETRVIGAFGYLAPEYIQTGLISEKSDVYAFGIVLLELLTGTKAIEFSRNIVGQQHLHLQEQGLERKIYNDIIDPRLHNNYIKKEAECMFHAAMLCISPHPEQRPRISKVLKILEGDMLTYTSREVYQKESFDGYSATRGERRYQTQDNNSHPMQYYSIHRVKLSSSNNNVDRNNYQSNLSRSKPPKTPPFINNNCNKVEPHELIVNQDYQEYLQGSLSKFIEKLSVK